MVEAAEVAAAEAAVVKTPVAKRHRRAQPEAVQGVEAEAQKIQRRPMVAAERRSSVAGAASWVAASPATVAATALEPAEGVGAELVYRTTQRLEHLALPAACALRQ